jgi:hypothetical protein
MASRNLEYIFKLIDQFSPNAATGSARSRPYAHPHRSANPPPLSSRDRATWP